MINLHALVHDTINSIHPFCTVEIYQSNGNGVVDGELVPVFLDAVEVKAQVQSESADAMYHTNDIAYAGKTRRTYLYYDNTKPAGLQREYGRGGDIIVWDGKYWLITAILEDFFQSGWRSVRMELMQEEPVITIIEEGEIEEPQEPIDGDEENASGEEEDTEATA